MHAIFPLRWIRRAPAPGCLTAGLSFHYAPLKKMNAVFRLARRAFIPVHRILRQRKMRLFWETLRPQHSDSLLDVGGGLGEDGEFAPLYEFFHSVTAINLNPASHGKATFVHGDACSMPFESKSYDYVFSNAVIEHVGDFQRQRMMADEIRRVAIKGYFVTTPNLWFPVDPHSYIPFLQLMPLKVRRRIIPFCDYWMLSRHMMTCLFPDAQIVTTPERTSIIAIGVMSTTRK